MINLDHWVFKIVGQKKDMYLKSDSKKEILEW